MTRSSRRVEKQSAAHGHCLGDRLSQALYVPSSWRRRSPKVRAEIVSDLAAAAGAHRGSIHRTCACKRGRDAVQRTRHCRRTPGRRAAAADRRFARGVGRQRPSAVHGSGSTLRDGGRLLAAKSGSAAIQNGAPARACRASESVHLLRMDHPEIRIAGGSGRRGRSRSPSRARRSIPVLRPFRRHDHVADSKARSSCRRSVDDDRRTVK